MVDILPECCLSAVPRDREFRSVRHVRRGADPGHPEARFYPSIVSMRALLDENCRFHRELVF